jgi:hypothetical protein
MIPYDLLGTQQKTPNDHDFLGIATVVISMVLRVI